MNEAEVEDSSSSISDLDEISIDGLEIDFTSKAEVPKGPPPVVAVPPPPPPPLPGKKVFYTYHILKRY